MRSILIAEDEDILRDTYQMVLQTEQYHVDVAVNGKEALERSKNMHYDLILLDLMMPVTDGVGFLEAYAAYNRPKSRIIVLSNLSSGNDLTRALQLGADRHVLKADLSPRQLLELVRSELSALK